ncbi:MAG: hypothetical protein JWN56_1715 [Sphingobacteriales bacterium]|nr:hypothetical protein [Sphingobacteriales bacterium]
MLSITGGIHNTASAQCAMCTMNAESSVKDGNTEGKGLNSGILYLLAAPYLAIGVVGYVWFKKYRKKDIVLDIKDEKINLN